MKDPNLKHLNEQLQNLSPNLRRFCYHNGLYSAGIVVLESIIRTDKRCTDNIQGYLLIVRLPFVFYCHTNAEVNDNM